MLFVQPYQRPNSFEMAMSQTAPWQGNSKEDYMARIKAIVGFSVLAVLILSTGFFAGFVSYPPIQAIRFRLLAEQEKKAEEKRFTETYMNKVVPEIASETLDGKKWYLTDQRGKVVLALFWSILCKACLDEIPVMNRMYSTYGKRKDFSLIGVHRFPEREIISCYCFSNRILWPQLYEGGEQVNSGFLNAMGIKRTPSICLIDKEGRVRRIGTDLNGIEQEIRILLEKDERS